MKTLAEYFGTTPTRFLPNGCGAGITAKIVPDELLGVEFAKCCSLHDLAYYIGMGGFWGLFWYKPQADLAMGWCQFKRFIKGAKKRYERKQWLKLGGTLLLTIPIPLLYIAGVTLLGFSPLTWPWIQRPVPTHEQLAALG